MISTSQSTTAEEIAVVKSTLKRNKRAYATLGLLGMLMFGGSYSIKNPIDQYSFAGAGVVLVAVGAAGYRTTRDFEQLTGAVSDLERRMNLPPYTAQEQERYHK
jgi:hypothetical protein